MVEVYEYHASTLLISYGMAILAGTIANILGLVAFKRNKVKIEKTVSFITSATQNSELVDAKNYHRRGSVPLPADFRDKKIMFEELETGGYGFRVVTDEENKVRREKKAKTTRDKEEDKSKHS
jgi:hypothetical protein